MPRAVPRPNWTPGGGMEDLLQWYSSNPDWELPEGYKRLPDGSVERDTHEWWDTLGKWAGPVGFGLAGGLGLAGMGTPAASSGMITDLASGGVPIGSGLPAGLPGAISAGGAGSTGAAMASNPGFWGKLFGSRGLDPTALLLGGLSFLGGDEGQERQSFEGSSVDPTQKLSSGFDMIQRLIQQLSNRPPTKFGSSVVQPGPAPVSIPGIPFQIGGGFGMDPALRDASLLMGQPPANAMEQPQAQSRPTRRRSPTSRRGGE